MKNWLILMLLISFGSIGAVCYTPGMPEITAFFRVNNSNAQLTVTLYLVGYAIGQLFYGPLAHSLGSNKTIIIGAMIEIMGAFLCAISGPLHSFNLLIIARVIMALGAASGLKMTFTLAANLYSKEETARVMGLLTLAFAVTPGIGVLIGGILVNYFGWTSTFYLMVVYGLAIILLSFCLPELYTKEDRHPLRLGLLMVNYAKQFTNIQIIAGGLLVGLGSCVVYVFAAFSPFIAMETMGLSPDSYGIYNFIPSFGILIGALTSNYYSKFWQPEKSLRFGLIISGLGTVSLFLTLLLWSSPLGLFMPMTIIYGGLSFIFGNSAALALHNVPDKSNGSAVMSFINMGSACVLVLTLGKVHLSHAIALPIIYAIMIIMGVIWYKLIIYSRTSNYSLKDK